MSSEVRCYNCDKLLGTVAEDVEPIIFPMAVRVEPSKMLYSTKCPRCGKMNHIKFKIK